MDPKVKSGHVTKDQEKQVLSDLSGYPNLAAMLALEKKLKLIKCRNRDNYKQNEPQISNSTESCSTDHKVTSGLVCKEETLQVLSDLTDFPNLAAPLSFDKAWKENGRTQRIECNPANSTYSCIPKEDEQRVLSDLTGFPNLAAMISEEKALKEKRKRQKTLSEAHSNSVNTMEQKHEVLEKQSVPSEVINVNAVAGDNHEELNKETVTDVKENKNIVIVPSQPVNRANGVEEGKQSVPSQPANIVNDVEDRRDDQRKRKADVLEEEHWEDSNKNTVEPTEEEKPKDLGVSSVPFDIYLPQLNKPSVETRNNVVHRKKPRGGRYFDDPAVELVMNDEFLARNGRKPKRCLFCGGLNHKAKGCKQIVDCFICNSRGHLEKDCPNKQIDKDESEILCLKCGDFGHDMVSCSNKYFVDDLKQIQCSVCMGFGHFSCVDYMVEECKQASCYKCGQLGHFGPDCEKLIEDLCVLNPRLFCYRCRQKGHYARECTRRNKAPGADSVSESIIPNLAPLRCNDTLPSSSNLQPSSSLSLDESVMDDTSGPV